MYYLHTQYFRVTPTVYPASPPGVSAHSFWERTYRVPLLGGKSTLSPVHVTKTGGYIRPACLLRRTVSAGLTDGELHQSYSADKVAYYCYTDCFWFGNVNTSVPS